MSGKSCVVATTFFFPNALIPTTTQKHRCWQLGIASWTISFPKKSFFVALSLPLWGERWNIILSGRNNFVSPPPPIIFPLECRSIHLVTVYFFRHVCTFLVFFFGGGESNSCSIGQINGWWCRGEGKNDMAGCIFCLLHIHCMWKGFVQTVWFDVGYSWQNNLGRDSVFA